MKHTSFLCVTLVAASFITGCKSHELARSANGSDTLKIVLVGTYTEKEDFVDGKATGMYVYSFSTQTGKLKYISSSPRTVNPSYLAIDPSGSKVYCVNETGGKTGGTISAFTLTSDRKQMEFVNTMPSEGNFPCYVSVDQTGKWVMCANYGSGSVAVLPVAASGNLERAVSIHQHKGKGKTSRQEGPHAHMIIQHPVSGFVYSCDLGLDTIFIYRLNDTNGKLTLTGHNYAVEPGAGPRHLAFHPKKYIAYEVNELNGTIEVMKIDSLTGTLSKIQTISTLDPGSAEEASCADIHLTPDGKYLYASNRGKVNNIAIYTVDASSGMLQMKGHQNVKGATPRNFVIDPSGKFLLVANQDSGNVVTFRIDESTGLLIDTGIEAAIPSPVCLKFLP
jgi:6-phosphogluconolactonase